MNNNLNNNLQFVIHAMSHIIILYYYSSSDIHKKTCEDIYLHKLEQWIINVEKYLPNFVVYLYTTYVNSYIRLMRRKYPRILRIVNVHPHQSVMPRHCHTDNICYVQLGYKWTSIYDHLNSEVIVYRDLDSPLTQFDANNILHELSSPIDGQIRFYTWKGKENSGVLIGGGILFVRPYEWINKERAKYIEYYYSEYISEISKYQYCRSIDERFLQLNLIPSLTMKSKQLKFKIIDELLYCDNNSYYDENDNIVI